MIEAKQQGNSVIIEGIEDFDTDHVFDCGQCFRWNKEEDGSWTGTASGRSVNVSSADRMLRIENCSVADFNDFWYDYLDLSRDYAAIKSKITDGDQVMEKAVAFGGGIRLLQQDPWETVISFIISQNSNIPRIKKCIEGLCRLFGDPLGEYRGEERYAFPKPEQLAGLTREDLAPVKLGYRDKYIIATADAVAADGGASLRAAENMPHDQAQKEIRKLKGVGPKVADCILLFGLHQYDSFPLDVWMKKIMSALYGFEEDDTKGMTVYAREHYGNLSGFAQEYLYYYARFNL
ncbi:MAG: DNA glycosylase [Anaerovoracaceae bacterium]|nr:DNA glycosylase [Bacillota bacterium]MDY2670433.1 DNA glycosylase [Anaerovoracaceae bacterium]